MAGRRTGGSLHGVTPWCVVSMALAVLPGYAHAGPTSKKPAGSFAEGGRPAAVVEPTPIPLRKPAPKKKGKPKKKKKGGAEPSGEPEVGTVPETPSGPGPEGSKDGRVPGNPPAPSPPAASASPQSSDGAPIGPVVVSSSEETKEEGASTSTPHPAFSAMLLAGYGVNGSSCGPVVCNAYGLGLGVRGGYTAPFRGYFGAAFVYHFGFRRGVNEGGFNTDYTGKTFYVGPEVGYDADISPFTMRVYAGAGIGVLESTQTPSAGINRKRTLDLGGTKGAFWPGVSVLFPVHGAVSVGADARYVVLLDGPSGFTLTASAGLAF